MANNTFNIYYCSIYYASLATSSAKRLSLLIFVVCYAYRGFYRYISSSSNNAISTNHIIYSKRSNLFPFLFVTVACGAVSGFHSLVSSGTSSKQLNSEKDTQLIGYGSMLIEGVVAIIALIAVGYVAKAKGTPAEIFANSCAVL